MKSCDFLKSRLNEGFLDDFFNAILDKTQGTTSEVALKNFTTEFAQKLNLFITQGIKTGKIDPNNTATIDSATGKPITSPGPQKNDSISEYVYNYINNIYKPNFDAKENQIYISLINSLQNNYQATKGKNELGKLAALLFDDGTQKRSKQQTSFSQPINFPKQNIEIEANVGNTRQKFVFTLPNKWTDQNGKPVTDANSIDALNSIASTQKTQAPIATPPSNKLNTAGELAKLIRGLPPSERKKLRKLLGKT